MELRSPEIKGGGAVKDALTKTHSDRTSLWLPDMTDLWTCCHTDTDRAVSPTHRSLIIIYQQYESDLIQEEKYCRSPHVKMSN